MLLVPLPTAATAAAEGLAPGSKPEERRSESLQHQRTSTAAGPVMTRLRMWRAVSMLMPCHTAERSGHPGVQA